MKYRRSLLTILFASTTLSCFGVTPGDAPPPPFPNEAFLKQIAEERMALIVLLNEMAKKSSMSEFGEALYRTIERFHGDPATVLEGCTGLLQADNIQIRLTTAEAFLNVGFRQSSAIGSLTEVMEMDQKQKIYLQGKLTDVRLYAARILAIHGVADAADKIWERYQADPDDKVLFALAEMGDHRPLEAIMPMLNKPGKLVRYADILGKLKATSTRESLEKAASTVLDGYKAKRALYWMTGEEHYLDELIASYDQGALGYLMPIKSPKVEALMKHLVRSPKQGFAEAAIITLHLNYPGSAEVRNAVVDYMKGERLSIQVSADIIFRIGCQLKDPEIDKLGEAIDTQAQESRWLHYAVRRNMVLDDPRMHLE